MDFTVSKNTSHCQSFHLKVWLNCLSIRRLLQQQLLESVILSGQRERSLERDRPLAELIPEKIPLCQLKNHRGVVYRCTLAFELASVRKLSPGAIARQLVTFLPTLKSDLSDQSQLDFTVRVVNPGWIDFHLSDRALAVWLQKLPQTLLFPETDGETGRGGDGEINAPTTNPFPIQYACARCCSLLRLGHRQGLIRLNDENFSQSVWQWVEPEPIPWLKIESEAQGFSSLEGGNFQLVHPAERHLIHQLLGVVEARYSPSQRNWSKIATDLSKAMLGFDRSCRIWGEVNRQTPELAQARLGLIALTQFLLGWLLQEQMGVSAPVEL